MKVDSFDNTLYVRNLTCRSFELLKDSRKIPEYIEISILKAF